MQGRERMRAAKKRSLDIIFYFLFISKEKYLDLNEKWSSRGRIVKEMKFYTLWFYDISGISTKKILIGFLV